MFLTDHLLAFEITSIVLLQNREKNRDLMPYVTAVLMTIALFFAAVGLASMDDLGLSDDDWLEPRRTSVVTKALVGLVLVALGFLAGAAFNHYFDRDIDEMMSRKDSGICSRVPRASSAAMSPL